MSRGLGRVQQKVLNVLRSDTETIYEGLPVGVFRERLRGIDRSNRRRAVRTLMARQMIHIVQGEDGEPPRVRRSTEGRHPRESVTGCTPRSSPA